MSEPLVECSFCHKHKDSVAKLIVGDQVAICNECVELCGSLLDDPLPQQEPINAGSLDPKIIKDHLDGYVIGQDRAKTVLSVAVVNHYKRISNSKELEIEKNNVLMLGPTGSGKTLLAKSVARYLDVPFVIADATSLTEAGYVGDDVESMIGRLLAAADGDLERCQRGIIFIDEIDKISRKGEHASITRDVSGEGVQQALLKLVEGTKCRVSSQNRKHPQSDTVEVDTSNILFIVGGAFVGLDEIVQNRLRGSTIGFGAELSEVQGANLEQVVPDDLVRFGLIPEFVGRFPTWVALQALTQSDLKHILTDVKNSLLQQYQWIFALDGIDLNIDDDALESIVDNTEKNNTGARGLHSEMERVLLPHMFNIKNYQNRNTTLLTITADLVNNPRYLE